ncbi:hypothetical protein [Streptomyces chartreusis]|uniref:hypothetical protein n=1 Tax=Streptomyces chartreusis TaxID=1969 RepID=UPI00340F5302
MKTSANVAETSQGVDAGESRRIGSHFLVVEQSNMRADEALGINARVVARLATEAEAKS